MGPINLEDATANAVNLNLPDGNCSDLGVPAPYGRNIAPMRIYHRRGRLIGESQEKVARAKSLPGMWGCRSQQRSPFSWPGEGGQVEDYARRGDEVDPPEDLTPIDRKPHLQPGRKSLMATRHFRMMGVEEINTPKSELLRSDDLFFLCAGQRL